MGEGEKEFERGKFKFGVTADQAVGKKEGGG